jgi:membrane protein DedA with SNARE-associated domain
MLEGYALLFVALVLDCAGLPLAGELLLVALGALVRGGLAGPLASLATAVSAAVVGHALGYWAGRIAGARLPPRARVRPPGVAPLLFSRFLVGARVLIAPMTGLAGVPFGRYLALDGAGAVVWVCAFMATGFLGGPWAEAARALAGSHPVALLVPAGVAIGAIALVVARRRLWSWPGAPSSPIVAIERG